MYVMKKQHIVNITVVNRVISYLYQGCGIGSVEPLYFHLPSVEPP